MRGSASLRRNFARRQLAEKRQRRAALELASRDLALCFDTVNLQDLRAPFGWITTFVAFCLVLFARLLASSENGPYVLLPSPAYRSAIAEQSSVVDRDARPDVAQCAFMAIVVKRSGVPHGDDVVGVITKEHVANSVRLGRWFGVRLEVHVVAGFALGFHLTPSPLAIGRPGSP
jgi:hypothetical protein